VTDVALGIKHLFQTLASKSIVVKEKAFIGSSAGADIGKALLFSDTFDSGENKIPFFDYFINTDGHSNPNAMPLKAQRFNLSHGINDSFYSARFDQGAVKTKVIILEGVDDETDTRKGSKDSHLETSLRYFTSNNVFAIGEWLNRSVLPPYSTRYTTHGGAARAIVENYRPVRDMINQFLGLKVQAPTPLQERNFKAAYEHYFYYLWDRNHDYSLDLFEAVVGSNRIWNPETYGRIALWFDANLDGKLNYKECLDVWSHYDRDLNGYLVGSEMQDYIKASAQW